jgi:23S rRNA (pseudouridine1915-N3)-methyltransferase
MKVTLLTIGKTDDRILRELIESYHKKLSYYARFRYEELPDVAKNKSTDIETQKRLEAHKIVLHTEKSSRLILLDENGTNFSSREFATFIEKQGVSGNSDLTFVVGGPYGFHPSLKEKAYALISLSKMTFTHQMVRLIFSEQLYRCFTILKGEPYHHD